MFRVLTEAESRTVKRWQAPSLKPGGEALTYQSVSSESEPSPGSIVGTENYQDQMQDLGEQKPEFSGDGKSLDGSESDSSDTNDVNGELSVSADMLQVSYDEGYSAGFAAGNTAAYDADSLNLEQLIGQLSHQRILLDEQLLEDLISLVKVTSGLVLNREVRIDASVIKDWLLDGMKRLPTVTDSAVVHMHPLDATSIKPLLDPEISVKIIESNELRRGDCYVKSGASSTRVGIHEQIDRLVSQMPVDDTDIVPAS